MGNLNQICGCHLCVKYSFLPRSRYAKEDTALTGTKGTKDTKEVKTKGKQKLSNENVENMEEHASKRTKV